jgi:hypothetical protein
MRGNIVLEVFESVEKKLLARLASGLESGEIMEIVIVIKVHGRVKH